jgi:adenylate cyclase
LKENGRRLAAIMFTDMVGYTALGQRNESLSLALAEEQRKLVGPILDRHSGREVKTIGDAIMVEFPNALDAIRCAYDIQRATREFNFSLSEDRRIHLRVGVHLGDVVESNGDISGDAVNVASRVESFAEDGGVCFTRQVYDQVANKLELAILSMGKKELKNVATPVEIFRVLMPWQDEPAAREADPKRIAILPFANMSQDPQDEYFADGMTEELISTLSKIGELSVISRTSVMQYKGKPKPVAEICEELKVGTILEGSVRKSGNKVRVTVQTVDAAKDRHLWAESYDRGLEDIFEIQSDIAQRVAAALRIQLLPSEQKDIDRRPTVSLEAYELCLKGHYHLIKETKEDAAKALGYFEEALKLDPRCAIALAGVSDYYHIGSHYGWYVPEDAFPLMKDYALKALEIDPRLAEAHAALGAVYFHYEWKWEDAEKELLKAIELKPSYELAREMYSYLLGLLGRFSESYEQASRAFQLGYLSTGTGIGGGLRLGSLEEGIARLEQVVRTRPDLPIAHDSLGFAYHRAHRTEDGIAEMRNAVSLSGGDAIFRADLALLLAMAGRREESDSILKELKADSAHAYISNVQMACIQYCLGRSQEAFDNLERAFARRAIDLGDIRLIPGIEGLRNDPRWISIEHRMGLRN